MHVKKDSGSAFTCPSLGLTRSSSIVYMYVGVLFAWYFVATGCTILSHILITDMCMQLLHVLHTFSFRIAQQCCAFLSPSFFNKNLLLQATHILRNTWHINMYCTTETSTCICIVNEWHVRRGSSSEWQCLACHIRLFLWMDHILHLWAIVCCVFQCNSPWNHRLVRTPPALCSQVHSLCLLWNAVMG